jgi:hypothetical protein
MLKGYFSGFRIFNESENLRFKALNLVSPGGLMLRAFYVFKNLPNSAVYEQKTLGLEESTLPHDNLGVMIFCCYNIYLQ